MKIESLVKVVSPDAVFEVYPDGNESAALFFEGRKVLSAGRITTGKFSESSGLSEKLRKHFANDGLSAEAESVNVIPFGCEYHVARQWKFAGNCGELTCDIAADNGGRIHELTLEEITFTGRAVAVEYWLLGSAEVITAPAEGVICEGSTLPVRVKVTFDDGIAAEFYCGDDFWRHNCAANYPGAAASHRIYAADDGIHWVRQVLSVPEDQEVEKRPWRFKALFGAGKADAAGVNSETSARFTAEGCFAAPVLRRNFRAFIRKQQANGVLLTVAGKAVCDDGSHINRPGKAVQHGMIGELFDEYLWASSAMARKGGSFAIESSLPEFSGSVITANLGKAACEVADGTQEEFEL